MMIRAKRIAGTLVLVLALVPALALAQSRTIPAPREGDMAVSGNLGFARPFADDFDDFEPLLSGSFEYHTSDRISWRGTLGFTEFDGEIDGRENEAELVFVNANIVHNWENGYLHPFVTGGVGIYDEDTSGPDLPGGDVEIGLNAGGGLDWFFESHWAIKFEGLLHGVSGDEPDSFFSATVGAKYWF